MESFSKFSIPDMHSPKIMNGNNVEESKYKDIPEDSKNLEEKIIKLSSEVSEFSQSEPFRAIRSESSIIHFLNEKVESLQALLKIVEQSTAEILDLNQVLEIGKFTSGAQGTVIKAIYPAKKQLIVIKIFNSFQEFKRESGILQKIENKEDIGTVNVLAQIGNQALITKSGIGSLYDWKQSRDKKSIQFSLEELLNIANRLFTIVFNLEKIGIYHRDIKPKNIVIKEAPKNSGIYVSAPDPIILVTLNSQIYLIDFGLAIDLNGKDNYEGQWAGTLGFVPKSMQEKHSFSKDDLLKNELYAIGITLKCLAPHLFLQQNELFPQEAEFAKSTLGLLELCGDPNSPIKNIEPFLNYFANNKPSEPVVIDQNTLRDLNNFVLFNSDQIPPSIKMIEELTKADSLTQTEQLEICKIAISNTKDPGDLAEMHLKTGEICLIEDLELCKTAFQQFEQASYYFEECKNLGSKWALSQELLLKVVLLGDIKINKEDQEKIIQKLSNYLSSIPDLSVALTLITYCKSKELEHDSITKKLNEIIDLNHGKFNPVYQNNISVWKKSQMSLFDQTQVFKQNYSQALTQVKKPFISESAYHSDSITEVFRCIHFILLNQNNPDLKGIKDAFGNPISRFMNKAKKSYTFVDTKKSERWRDLMELLIPINLEATRRASPFQICYVNYCCSCALFLESIEGDGPSGDLLDVIDELKTINVKLLAPYLWSNDVGTTDVEECVEDILCEIEVKVLPRLSQVNCLKDIIQESFSHSEDKEDVKNTFPNFLFASVVGYSIWRANAYRGWAFTSDVSDGSIEENEDDF